MKKKEDPKPINKVLAIDQSMVRSGIAVIEKRQLKGLIPKPHILMSSYVDLCGEHSVRRKAYCNTIHSCIQRYAPDAIIVERVRMFSKGIVNIKTIIALGVLAAYAVDVAYPIPVYSIDTRMWKARILGSASATKQDAVNFSRKLGYNKNIEIDNDDQADALCIALCSLYYPETLKEEK